MFYIFFLFVNNSLNPFKLNFWRGPLDTSIVSNGDMNQNIINTTAKFLVFWAERYKDRPDGHLFVFAC